MAPSFEHPLDPQALLEQVLSAVNRDIEPLQPAKSYPRDLSFREMLEGSRPSESPFRSSMLFGLGREKYLTRYGHVLLSRECLDALKTVIGERRALDVCAGGGYLAHALANEGVDIQAVDLYPPGDEPTERDPRTRWKIDFTCSALELSLRDYDVLLLVWPSHGSPFADQVAAAMRPGQLLIYQGEAPGAATASDEFFERLSGDAWELLRPPTEALNKDHVQFQGMHDRWYVFQRGPVTPE